MADPITSSGGGSGGGGFEDDTRPPQTILRNQGLLTLAYGFALGVTFVALLWLLRWFAPSPEVKNLVDQLLWWQVFLFGFIGGTLVSAIYNLLVLRRLNLFGLDSGTD